ncbi:MAG: zinc ribbon domain-containing protein [Methanomassiliicoccales archaeon]
MNDVSFCPYCGERIVSGANFCPKCGRQLPVTGSSSSMQQQNYAPQPRTYSGRSKPEAAIVLSIIAGVFILINGILVAALGAILLFSFLPAGIIVLGAGLIFGLIVFIAAIKLNQKPEEHLMWGVVILVFSILSIVIGGGFIIGLILGFIGGLLAILWNK